MDISDGPFNKPLLGKKNIRFTPTNSRNPILMAHSCGLGGKYWYKHTKVCQTEHLKRARTMWFTNLTFFLFVFPCWVTVSNLFITNARFVVHLQLDLHVVTFREITKRSSDWYLGRSCCFRPTTRDMCNVTKAKDSPLRARYRMHHRVHKCCDCVCVRVCVWVSRGCISQYFHSLPTLLESCNVIKVY